MDYYQIAMTLNKGYNRILELQLGKYDRVNANFSLRITDKEHNSIVYLILLKYKTIPKSKNVAIVPYAVLDLQSKIQEKTKRYHLLNTFNKNSFKTLEPR